MISTNDNRPKKELWADLADEFISLQKIPTDEGGYESIVVRKTKDMDEGMVSWFHGMVFPAEYTEDEIDYILADVFDCKQSDFDPDSIMGFLAAYLAEIQDAREVPEDWAMAKIKEITDHELKEVWE